MNLDAICQDCERPKIHCECNIYQKARAENLAILKRKMGELFPTKFKTPTPKKKRKKLREFTSPSGSLKYGRLRPRRSDRIAETNERKALSHPKANVVTLDSCRKVQCSICKAMVSNLNNLDEEVLLRYHRGRVGCHRKAGRITFTSQKHYYKRQRIEDDISDDFEATIPIYDDSSSSSGGGSDSDSEGSSSRPTILPAFSRRLGQPTSSPNDDVNDDDDDYDDDNGGYCRNDNYDAAEDEVLEDDYDYNDIPEGQGQPTDAHECDNEELQKLLGRKYTPSKRQIMKYPREVTAFRDDPFNFQVRDEIWKCQITMHRVFDGSQKGLTFRNCDRFGKLEPVEWVDLAKIYEFGLSVGLSGPEGDLLLQLFQDIFDRHPGTAIQLRKTWKGLEDAVKNQKLKETYQQIRYEFPLPSQYFGTVSAATKKNTQTVQNNCSRYF